MSGAITILVLIAILIIGLSMGHHLGFVLMASGLIVGVFTLGFSYFPLFMNRIWGTMTKWELLAIPLFLLMGNILSISGIAENLFESLHKLMGRLNGGIAIAVVIVSTIFAACTGVIAASVTAMAILSLPIMFNLNYNKELAAGTVMAGGTLGILIPPSIMLILFGSYANVSVGKLFLAAVFPGLLLSGLYMIYIIIRGKINPDDAPAMSKEEIAGLSKKSILKDALVNLLPPVVLIIGILGSIYAGIATPTEAAAIGAFVSFLMVLAYGKFDWKLFKKSITDTADATAMILMLIIGASFFTATFLGTGGKEFVENLLMNLSGGNAWIAFSIMMIIVFFLGMFVDWIGIAMITLPIFVPIAKNLGFDPLWFLMIIAINLQTSFLTPPFGYAIFYIKSTLPPVTEPNSMYLREIYKSVVPFIAIQIVGFILCVLFPKIVTWLPSIMIK